MFNRESIEKFDAARGIPRKANEQYLPAYQAFWVWANDLGQAALFIFIGFIGAGLSLFSGSLLQVSGLIWLVFWAFALLSLASGLFDAYMLSWSYHVWTMSTSHGSARWAKLSDLVSKKLVKRIKGSSLPKNSLPVAKVFGGRDLYLPKAQWLRHFVMFGPTGSGKSKTFFMRMIRAVCKNSSVLVYDPKGELYEQTGNFTRNVYRLDLNNPESSDRWNFIPACRENPAFACEVAGMMIGVENRQKTTQDPFWGDAEQLALTAILLHLAEVYGDRAIPAFAADFLIGLGGKEKAFGAELENSPSFFAKQAYFAFRRSPPQTHGSVLIGLYNKLRPFTLAPARSVTIEPTNQQIDKGCRIIDFRELRRKGTAVFLVVSEGAAEMYKEFIATFLGQAVLEMRLDGVNEPKTPCFVLIDEAYQLNVSEVKRISGIGRGRGVGLGLGYQDLPQMYDQYGREQANAILGTIMTKIFLPGLDDVTAEYASKQIGDTTIYAKTYQDFPGKKSDNIRYAEQKRSLIHSGEVRQIAAHKELLIVNDTAPPIRAAYPPIAVTKVKRMAADYGSPDVLYLGDVDPRYDLNGRATDTKNDHPSSAANAATQEQKTRNLVDEAVSEVLGENGFLFDVKSDGEKPDTDSRSGDTDGSAKRNDQKETVILTKTIDSDLVADALDGLSDDVRNSETYDRSLSDINRSLI